MRKPYITLPLFFLILLSTFISTELNANHPLEIPEENLALIIAGGVSLIAGITCCGVQRRISETLEEGSCERLIVSLTTLGCGCILELVAVGLLAGGFGTLE